MLVASQRLCNSSPRNDNNMPRSGRQIIPNAFPTGTTTLAGVAVPKGATVYYEMRVRARVFASIVGGEKQERFLEV